MAHSFWLQPVQQTPGEHRHSTSSFTPSSPLPCCVTCRSQVFVWNGGLFRRDHTFNTQQASDVAFLPAGPYLVVASESAGLSILTREGNGTFTNSITLPLAGPVRVEPLSIRGGGGDATVIVVTNRRGSAQSFRFDDGSNVPLELTVSGWQC